jgi:acetate CoA/acetoacetate CoA-transferase alpha subunit
MALFVSLEKAIEMIPDGASIMVSGFMGCGNPHKIIDALAKSGKGNFKLICNDGAQPGGPMNEAYYGVAKLIHNRQVKHMVATHVGLNPEVGQQMHDGSLRVDLIPQGSFAEMIRSGGAGLGGVVTPTGVGTIVENYQDYVHAVQEIDGRKYLLMKPIRADFALISGYKVDTAGNIWYKGATRNFALAMATAADVVIVEADHVVEAGGIEPENVMTSGIFIDYIVDGEQANG